MSEAQAFLIGSALHKPYAVCVLFDSLAYFLSCTHFWAQKNAHEQFICNSCAVSNAPDSIVLYPPYSSKKEFPPPNASNPVKFSGVEVFCGAAAGEETGGVS